MAGFLKTEKITSKNRQQYHIMQREGGGREGEGEREGDKEIILITKERHSLLIKLGFYCTSIRQTKIGLSDTYFIRRYQHVQQSF